MPEPRDDQRSDDRPQYRVRGSAAVCGIAALLGVGMLLGHGASLAQANPICEARPIGYTPEPREGVQEALPTPMAGSLLLILATAGVLSDRPEKRRTRGL